VNLKKPVFKPCFESDVLMIGKDMRLMINKLVNIGVGHPSVGAILIQKLAVPYVNEVQAKKNIFLLSISL
jgi:hypothetical protein